MCPATALWLSARLQRSLQLQVPPARDTQTEQQSCLHSLHLSPDRHVKLRAETSANEVTELFTQHAAPEPNALSHTPGTRKTLGALRVKQLTLSETRYEPGCVKTLGGCRSEPHAAARPLRWPYNRSRSPRCSPSHTQTGQYLPRSSS